MRASSNNADIDARVRETLKKCEAEPNYCPPGMAFLEKQQEAVRQYALDHPEKGQILLWKAGKYLAFSEKQRGDELARIARAASEDLASDLRSSSSFRSSPPPRPKSSAPSSVVLLLLDDSLDASPLRVESPRPCTSSCLGDGTLRWTVPAVILPAGASVRKGEALEFDVWALAQTCWEGPGYEPPRTAEQRTEPAFMLPERPRLNERISKLVGRRVWGDAALWAEYKDCSLGVCEMTVAKLEILEADGRSSDQCASCFTHALEPMQCGSCHSTIYCSRDCQKAEWKSHKKLCGKLKKKALDPPGEGSFKFVA